MGGIARARAQGGIRVAGLHRAGGGRRRIPSGAGRRPAPAARTQLRAPQTVVRADSKGFVQRPLPIFGAVRVSNKGPVARAARCRPRGSSRCTRHFGSTVTEPLRGKVDAVAHLRRHVANPQVPAGLPPRRHRALDWVAPEGVTQCRGGRWRRRNP